MATINSYHNHPSPYLRLTRYLKYITVHTRHVALGTCSIAPGLYFFLALSLEPSPARPRRRNSGEIVV